MDLLFKNPTFNLGRNNTTCRRGDKWAHAKIPQGGFPIINTNNPGVIIGYAYDIYTQVLPFKDIRDIDLATEHDPSCRTREGLLKVMQETYPGFSEDEEVTLLHFLVRTE